VLAGFSTKWLSSIINN